MSVARFTAVPATGYRYGFLFALALVFSCSTGEKKTARLTDFHILTLEGETVDVSKYQGKRVFINVWATWCRPCVQEMPTIAEAMKQLEGENVVFIFASPEDPEEIIGFRDRRDFPFDYVRLTNLESLSIEALPTTFIFDVDGNLEFGEEGFRNWSTPDNLSIIKASAP